MPTTSPAPYAIATQDLAKDYRTDNGVVVNALRGINLNVRNGEIYALLGPNGAGKTTTIGILTTQLLPTGGSALVAGYDVVANPSEVRRHIGVTFQEVVLDKDLTGRHILDFHGRLYGLPAAERRARIDELSTLVELTDALDRRTGGYSGGMKRRLELARGLMTRPDILFLDEPTQGLDPQNRAGIWRYIRRLRDESGLTLLLTTHYMEEAEALADRVGIVDQGRMVVEGTAAELVREMGADVVTIRGVGEIGPLLATLQDESYVAKVSHHLMEVAPYAQTTTTGGELAAEAVYQLQIGVDQGDRRLVSLLAAAAAQGFQVHEVSINRPSLSLRLS
jgi:ABC-2 type transport system ATP-binding protein